MRGSLRWIVRQRPPEDTHICGNVQPVANVAQVNHVAVANTIFTEMCCVCFRL